MSRASLAVLCGLAAHASASPRSDPTTGRAVFTGATVPSATSIDLDPAAIGLVLVKQVYIAAMAVVDHYAIRRDTLDINTGNLSPGSSVHDNELGPGGMLAFLWPINERATLGFELRSAPSEQFITGQNALRYYTLGGSQRTYTAGIGTSFRITNDFYFGLSLATDTTYLHLHYARDTALANGHGPNGIDSDCGGSPCGVENPIATENYDVNVRSSFFSTSNLVVNLGLMVQVAKDVWVAAAYHAPPGLDIQTELTGSMDVLRAPRDGGNLLHGDSTVFLSQPASADLEVRARLPRQLDLHVGVRWEDLSRLQAYDVRGYDSVFPNAGIPEWQLRTRGFHDPFSLWAGVEQNDTGETWRFGGRIGVETSSVPDDSETPLSIAPRSYTADLGVQLRVPGSPVIVQLSYGLQYFPTVDVTNSSFDPRNQIACIDAHLDYSTAACEAVRFGYALPTAAGRYDRIEQAVRLGIRYDFP